MGVDEGVGGVAQLKQLGPFGDLLGAAGVHRLPLTVAVAFDGAGRTVVPQGAHRQVVLRRQSPRGEESAVEVLAGRAEGVAPGRGVSEAARSRGVDDSGQALGDQRGKVVTVAGVDGQGVLPVHPVPDAQVTEHPVGVFGEDGIDGDPLVLSGVVSGRGVGELEELGRQCRQLAALLPAPENEDVGDDLGAGDTAERGGGQAHGTHEVAERGDLAARPLVLRIEGVPGGQQHRVPTGGGQRQRLDDEVVVDGVLGLVVHRVVEPVVPERHVPDDRGERTRRDGGPLEPFGADLRRRGQGRGDRGGGGVELDTDHLRRRRRVSDEGARPASGFEDAAAGEAGVLQCRPHRVGDRRVGVVGIEDGALCLRVRGVVEQRPNLSPFGGPVALPGVEHLRCRTPARPSRENGLLCRGGVPVLLGDPGEHAERVDVRPHAGPRPRRHQHLAAGPEVHRLDHVGSNFGVGRRDRRCRAAGGQAGVGERCRIGHRGEWGCADVGAGGVDRRGTVGVDAEQVQLRVLFGAANHFPVAACSATRSSSWLVNEGYSGCVVDVGYGWSSSIRAASRCIA